jgi:hypothetical protein
MNEEVISRQSTVNNYQLLLGGAIGFRAVFFGAKEEGIWRRGR